MAVRAVDVSGDVELDIIIATVSDHLARTSTGMFVDAGKVGDTGVTPRGGGGGASLPSTARVSGAGGSIACTEVKSEPVATGCEASVIPEVAPCPANKLYATFKLSRLAESLGLILSS